MSAHYTMSAQLLYWYRCSSKSSESSPPAHLTRGWEGFVLESRTSNDFMTQFSQYFPFPIVMKGFTSMQEETVSTDMHRWALYVSWDRMLSLDRFSSQAPGQVVSTAHQFCRTGRTTAASLRTISNVDFNSPAFAVQAQDLW